MITEELSVTSYIDEIKPMVQNFHSEQEILERFETSLDLLRKEALKCDDTLKIFLCWQDGIARELNTSYTLSSLKKLHEMENSQALIEGTEHILSSQNQFVNFHFCDHNMYTPIRSSFTLHQCLRC